MNFRLVREPLIHFLVLGGVIFGAYSWLGDGQEVADDASSIVIDQAEVNYLKGLWKLQWKRDPAPGDVAAIIDRYVRQEVFYREALKMKLDHNDEIIRKRLSQKMEAVASDLGMLMRPPTEEQLKAFHQLNAALFTLPNAYAFKQVLYPADEDGAPQAELTLASLRNGGAIPASLLNEMSLKNEWPMTSEGDIENAFGGDFSKSLAALPVGQWSGPVRSGYGLHLVYIEKKQDAALADFDQVRDYVAREYEYRSVLESQDNLYRELLGKYDVRITAEDVPAAVKSEFGKK